MSGFRGARCGLAVALAIALAAARPGVAESQETDAAPSLGEAYALLQAGHAREAEAAFRALAAAAPEDPQPVEGLVWTYLRLGEPDRAAEAADARLALAPSDAAWRRRWLEVVSLVPERREEAIAGYRALVAAHPDDVSLRLQLGTVLAWSPAHREEAIAELEDVLEAAPDNGEARLTLAQTLAWQGHLERAAAEYDRLLEGAPTDVEALLGRAQVARWAGDLEAARHFVRRGLLLAPDDPRLEAERAALELGTGELMGWQESGYRAAGVTPAATEVASGPNGAPPPALDARERWRVGARQFYSGDSSLFTRLTSRVFGELAPLAATRLRLAADWSRFRDGEEDQLDRVSLGLDARQELPLALWVSARYRLHLAQETPAGHEAGAVFGGPLFTLPVQWRLAGRLRPLVETPLSYEGIALLEGVGSAGMTVAGIREQIEVFEGEVGVTAAPFSGAYVYAEGTYGTMSDDNQRRSAAAGLGVDLLGALGLGTRFGLTVRYDLYYLAFREERADYFAPASFLVHTPGVEWTWRPWSGSAVGAEGGLPLTSRGGVGVSAGGFFGLPFGGGVALEGRVRYSDDTEYGVLAATLGISVGR